MKIKNPNFVSYEAIKAESYKKPIADFLLKYANMPELNGDFIRENFPAFVAPDDLVLQSRIADKLTDGMIAELAGRNGLEVVS